MEPSNLPLHDLQRILDPLILSSPAYLNYGCRTELVLHGLLIIFASGGLTVGRCRISLPELSYIALAIFL